MHPLDLKTKEEWDELLSRLAQEVNMTASLTDENGTILQTQRDRYPLCAKIRERPENQTFICSQSNTAMLAVVKKTLEPVIDYCEGGLFRAVVPIVREGRLVGQVTVCGLMPDDESFDPFFLAKQLETGEEEINELAKSSPRASEDDFISSIERLFAEINP